MQSTDRSRMVVGWLLAATFLVFGALATINHISYCLVGYASQSWPSTTGTIISSSFEPSYYSDDGYKVVLRYRYEVDGQSYECDLISPGNPVMGENSARHLSEKYHAGSTVTVYYNPHSPNEAILEPGAGAGLILGTFVSLLVMAAGGVLMYVFLTQPQAR